MENLYAPWRDKYITNEDKHTTKDKDKNNKCIFCDIVESDRDKENYVVYKNKLITVVMNLYPYSNGHILILPNEHKSKPSLLKNEIWIAMNQKSLEFVEILEQYGAQAINVGININKEAGAGIPEHLHMHLVPRWEGDSNFMSVVANTRVISRDFNKTYEEIVELSNNFFGNQK